MNPKLELLFRAVLIGAGATMLINLWAAALRRFGIKSLDFALLGRWLGHLPDGQLMHESIGRAPPVRGELILGWVAHYGIGISFAGLLLVLFGLEWAHAPRFLPALAIGVMTVVAPLFVLQPALGAGMASSKTPTPIFNSLKSLSTHTVFGIGLYLAARASAALPLSEVSR